MKLGEKFGHDPDYKPTPLPLPLPQATQDNIGQHYFLFVMF